jgi:hypothetical protein
MFEVISALGNAGGRSARCPRIRDAARRAEDVCSALQLPASRLLHQPAQVSVGTQRIERRDLGCRTGAR